MPAEGIPPEENTLLGQFLVGLTKLVVRFPCTTLGIAGLMVVAATYFSTTCMTFRTSRLDLLNPKSEFNKRWIDYINEFGDAEDVVVVLEGANRTSIDAAARKIVAALEKEPQYFNNILYEIDQTRLTSKGLYFLAQQDLVNIEYFLDRMEPILRGDWNMLKLGNIEPQMFGQLQEITAANPAALAAAQAELLRFSQGLLLALRGEYKAPWPDMPLDAKLSDGKSPKHILESEKLGIILLKLTKETAASADFARNGDAIRRLRERVQDMQAENANLKIGLTGIPIIEYDEMNSSKVSMIEASGFELIGVSLLFIVGFGGWRHPLLAVTSLSVGTYWTMGYIAVVIGHLNILSSAFAVILIGQGIDFSMYFVAEYLQTHAEIRAADKALVKTVRHVGPGIAIGALTTAIAFFMAGFTDFTGVAELGIIAGGGILLCWLAGVTVLPAMIKITDTRWPTKHVPTAVDVCSWMQPFLAKPALALTLSLGATALIACGLDRLWYDHNLMHMQAKGLESVALEKRLTEEDNLSASFAISIADSPLEVLARKQKFLEKGSVKRVDELASMMPNDIAAKQPIIDRIHRRLVNLPPKSPQISVVPPHKLAPILEQMRAVLGTTPQMNAVVDQLDGILAALQKMTPADYYARVSAFQQKMAQDLLDKLLLLQSVSNSAPPERCDLPASLASRFISPHGKYLMRIYSRGDIWDMSAMEKFVADVRSVDTNATGNPLQIYEASRQMQTSYQQAAFYALIVILPVVFFDFRSQRFSVFSSVRHMLLALLPLGLGMLQMFGVMGLLNIPLNAANMIVLPLILGIGIDAGVHIVHDFCSQRGRYKMNSATASAVVINSVTNMAGFGSLMIASHQGLQSLGRVLTIGMSTNLFSSLVILPALLVWISRNRKEEPVEEEYPETENAVFDNEDEEAEMPIQTWAAREPVCCDAPPSDISEPATIFRLDSAQQPKRHRARSLAELWSESYAHPLPESDLDPQAADNFSDTEDGWEEGKTLGKRRVR